MISKVYRIQAYITWMLYVGLGLLVFVGGYDLCNTLRRAGVLLLLMLAGLVRLLLPLGTVLAVFARRKGFSPNSLLHHQLITFGLSLPMPIVLLMLLTVITGA